MRFIILLVLMLYSTIACSQDYPKIAIINTDTVAMLRIDHIKRINSKLIDLKQRTSEVSELNYRINLYDKSITSLNRQLEMNKIIISSYESQINNYKYINSDLEKRHKKQKRKAIVFKSMTIAISISAITLLLLK